VDTIKIAGLNILLEQTPAGPIMSVADQRLEPLAWVVNSAITGGAAAGLADALARGDDLIVQGLYAARPEPDDPLVDGARQDWLALTGCEAGEDIYTVGTTFCEQEFVIPRRALAEILSGLKGLHRQTPPAPVPWLFCPDPIHPDPGPGEEDILRGLETDAARLKSLETQAGTTLAASQERLAAVSAKRRFLIADLAAAGLLNEAHADNKRLWLTTWQLPLLLEYFEAALELRLYFSSADRRQFIPEAGPEPVQGARVSLDWFRFPPQPPQGFNAHQWLGYCESIFMAATDTGGGEGDIFIHEGRLRYHLCWRKDDGITAALVSATPC